MNVILTNIAEGTHSEFDSFLWSDAYELRNQTCGTGLVPKAEKLDEAANRNGGVLSERGLPL